MVRNLIRSRKAISYGIIVALITIVAIASAALIAVWIFGAGAASTRKATFEVIGVPLVSTTTQTLSVTVKNLGGIDAYVVRFIIGGQEVTSGWSIVKEKGNEALPADIPKATTVTISVPLPASVVNVQGSANLKWGDSVNCQLITDQGTLPFTAYVTD